MRTVNIHDIHVFVFNWPGQYLSTRTIEVDLARNGIAVTVINSDDDESFDGWIDIGNTCFFSRQFTKALDLFGNEKLIFCHIQGDTSYHDWTSIIKDAILHYATYTWGIYAPNVDYTWYTSDKTDIHDWDVQNTNIRLVADTDCSCWFIHQEVIDEFSNRQIDMSDQKFGWGWDLCMCGLSFLLGRPVLRDYRHTVKHPRGTGYDKSSASHECYRVLYPRLDPDLQKVIRHIKIDRDRLAQYMRSHRGF